MAIEDRYRQMHSRLLTGDPVAPAELADAVMEPLFRKLQAAHPRLKDTDYLHDAACDALMSYLKRPAQFNPEKSSLMGYLVMSAGGDLRNALAKGRRRRAHEVPVDDVELQRLAGNQVVRAPVPSSGPEVQQAREGVEKMFRDAADRKAVHLMAEGERSTDAFAALWGLQGLGAADRRREVKRHKDRIKKTLERHRKGSSGHPR